MRCERCRRLLTEETADRRIVHGASGPGRTIILCKELCRSSPGQPRRYPS
jgi:hypothetical protein